MSNQDVIPNQERVFIHVKLQDDLAYQYSVRTHSLLDMKLVLRAHGESHTDQDGIDQLETGAALSQGETA